MFVKGLQIRAINFQHNDASHAATGVLKDLLHIRVNLLRLRGNIPFTDRLQLHIHRHLAGYKKGPVDLNRMRVAEGPVQIIRGNHFFDYFQFPNTLDRSTPLGPFRVH